MRKILLCIAAAWLPSAAVGQDYPARLIRTVSVYPAGSAADINTRFYADQLSKRLGQPVIVENRAGAEGVIGTEYAAKAKPDGYTLLVTQGSALAMTRHLHKSPPYDMVRDFDSVTTLHTGGTFVLVVGVKSPYRSVAELIGGIKAKGNRGLYASIHIFSRVCAELLLAAHGVKAEPVNYRTSVMALNGFDDNQIEFMYQSVTGTRDLLRTGKVRALAVCSGSRIKAMPDLPSAPEAGVPGSDVNTWWSVHVPKKTPVAVIEKLEASFNDIVRSKDTEKYINSQNAEPLPGNRRLLDEMLAREVTKWGEYIRLAKIEKQ